MALGPSSVSSPHCLALTLPGTWARGLVPHYVVCATAGHFHFSRTGQAAGPSSPSLPDCPGGPDDIALDGGHHNPEPALVALIDPCSLEEIERVMTFCLLPSWSEVDAIPPPPSHIQAFAEQEEAGSKHLKKHADKGRQGMCLLSLKHTERLQSFTREPFCPTLVSQPEAKPLFFSPPPPMHRCGGFLATAAFRRMIWVILPVCDSCLDLNPECGS